MIRDISDCILKFKDIGKKQEKKNKIWKLLKEDILTIINSAVEGNSSYALIQFDLDSTSAKNNTSQRGFNYLFIDSSKFHYEYFLLIKEELKILGFTVEDKTYAPPTSKTFLIVSGWATTSENLNTILLDNSEVT